MNSREKGKRGERQWRDELRANGYAARRGQQFSGSPESPDVICDELDWIHFEVKAVERLNIEDAMDQARRDAGQEKTPVVSHKRNHRPWLVTVEAETFFRLLRGELPPANKTDGTNETSGGAHGVTRPAKTFSGVLGESPNTAREARALPSTKTTEQTEQTKS